MIQPKLTTDPKIISFCKCMEMDVLRYIKPKARIGQAVYTSVLRTKMESPKEVGSDTLVLKGPEDKDFNDLKMSDTLKNRKSFQSEWDSRLDRKHKHYLDIVFVGQNWEKDRQLRTTFNRMYFNDTLSAINALLMTVQTVFPSFHPFTIVMNFQQLDKNDELIPLHIHFMMESDTEPTEKEHEEIKRLSMQAEQREDRP